MNGQIMNTLQSLCPFLTSQTEGRCNLLQSKNKMDPMAHMGVKINMMIVNI